MSNIINNNLLSSEATTNTGTTTGSTSEQTIKDKPSLFDSLLASTTEVIEEKVVVAENKEAKVEIAPTTEEKVEVVGDKKEQKIDISPSEVKEEKVVGNSASSLLDRLVIEAKKEVKDINKEELNNKIDSLLTPTISTTEEKVEVVKEENKNLEITKEVENKEKVVGNTTSSLLDRLVIEAKKEVKDINKEELNNKIDSLLTPTISTTENKEVVGEQKVEIGKEEVVKEENKNLEITKEVENKEKVVGNTTSSLLDRLVIEAKKEVKDINKEELNNKIDSLLTPTISTTENKEVVGEQKVEILNLGSSLNSGVTSFLSDGEVSQNLIPTDENITVVIPTTIPEENKEPEIVIKKDAQLSLMDKLIQKNSETITLETINSNIDTPSKEVVAKDLISSIYLGSQKNQANNQSLFNKNEAVSLLKDGSSIQAVKTSAEILELGLENIEVEQIAEVEKLDIKKSNIETVDRKNLIDSILSQKNIKSEEVRNLITKSVEASNALIENSINLTQDVTVNVNSPIAYNIQSRIIGAKQQMSAMMSDIAKQMYENYKPPVTAFKIHLNPLDLGSIAILMKTDKNNGLSISLSISNNTTLEALIENQNVLRNSLNKTFDENTKFNLDFSSSNQNSDNSSANNQNGQGSNRRFEQQMDTQSILQMKDENKDKEEKVIDYM